MEYSITSTTSASTATPQTPSALENDAAGPSALEEASRGCRPVALTSHIMKAEETLHKLHLLHVFICHYYTYRHAHSSSLHVAASFRSFIFSYDSPEASGCVFLLLDSPHINQTNNKHKTSEPKEVVR